MGPHNAAPISVKPLRRTMQVSDSRQLAFALSLSHMSSHVFSHCQVLKFSYFALTSDVRCISMPAEVENCPKATRNVAFLFENDCCKSNATLLENSTSFCQSFSFILPDASSMITVSIGRMAFPA